MKKITVKILIIILIGCMGTFLNSKTQENQISQSSVVEVKGTIEAVMTEIPVTNGTPGRIPIAFIKIKIKEPGTNREHLVQVAPGSFLRTNGVFLRKNIKIKINGFKQLGSPEIKTIALEINGRMLTVRDRTGKGLWEKPEIRANRTGGRIR